jgi:hypothetical protein
VTRLQLGAPDDWRGWLATGNGWRACTRASGEGRPVVPASSTVRYCPISVLARYQDRLEVATASLEQLTAGGRHVRRAPRRCPSRPRFRRRAPAQRSAMSRSSRSVATSSGTVSDSGNRVAALHAGARTERERVIEADRFQAVSVPRSQRRFPRKPTMMSVVRDSRNGIAEPPHQSRYPSRVYRRSMRFSTAGSRLHGQVHVHAPRPPRPSPSPRRPKSHSDAGW